MEPYGYGNRANPGIGVQGEAADFVEASYVFSRQLRQVKRTGEGQADLTSMRVTGELKVNRIVRNTVREIRFMRQQNCRFRRRNIAQRTVKVCASPEHVVNTAQPKTSTIALDRSGLIQQHLNSPRPQSGRHVIWIAKRIVVPHHRPQPVWRCHLLQQLGARFSHQCALLWLAEQRNRNKVAGKHNQLGMKGVDYVDRGAKGMNGKVRIVVKVTELSDGEAIQARRPTSQANLLPDDSNAIGFKERRVHCESADARSRSETEKSASIDGRKSQSVLG
jgi:hypothetical protein